MLSIKSKITKVILNYFFLNPEETLYVNEIARIFGADKRNLVKKLRELETLGILSASERGNQKYYGLNKKYPLLTEYKKIISKTSGLELQIKQVVDSFQGVNAAYIFGSYAAGQMDELSDIDVLVVGSHKAVDILKEIYKLQKETGREINLINIDSAELEKKLSSHDPFYSGIMKGWYIKIK